jgi:hypothetical protein
MESIVADVSFSMLIIRWHQNRPNADDAKKAERILQHLTEAKNTLEEPGAMIVPKIVPL